MNPSEETYPYIEQEFVRETVKRQVAKHPHSAPKIVLQLLTKLKQQSHRQYDLQQKYDKLLESYLDLNEAYLATLDLLRDRAVPRRGRDRETARTTLDRPNPNPS